MRLKKDLYKTAYKSLALKFCGAGINFFLGIVIARTLGAAGFGVYSVVLSLTTLFGLLSSLGLPSFYTRETAILQSNRHYRAITYLYKSTAKLVLVTSSFLTLAAASLVYYRFLGIDIDDMAFFGWIFVILIIPFHGLNLNRAGLLRGMHKIISADSPEVFLKPVVVLLMIFISIWFGISLNIEIIFAFQLFACILVFLIISKLISKELNAVSWNHIGKEKKYDGKIKKSWLVFLVISVLTILQTQIPLYLASFYIDSKSAGLYQSCILIVNVMALGLTAVNSPLQPKLASAWNKNNVDASQKLVGISVGLASFLAVFFMIVIYISSEWILGFYGEEFIDAKNTLIILLFGQLINAFCGPCALMLIMANKQYIVVWVYSISIVLGIAVAQILLPKYELNAIALSSLVMMATWNLIMTYICARELGIKTLIFQNIKYLKVFGATKKL